MAAPPVPNWQQQVLRGVGAPVTPQNLLFVNDWSKAEGGGAANNPFNTTQPAGGATSYNGVGVRNYTSPQQGIQATVQTLENGRYGNILGALKQGTDARAAAAALAASPWGTGSLVEKMLGGGETAPAASAPTASPLAVATTRTAPQPQVNESKLLAALSGANSNGGDYSQFYATLKQALHPAAAPAQTSYPSPQPAAAHAVQAVQAASAGQAGLPFEGASTQGVKQSLLDAVSQAAQAAGATQIRITSGARSAAHNQAVGGVQGSNHLTGDAVDGYARVGKQWVPLGQLLLKTASRYGLRSGDVPGFFNGGTDPVHVDDGANVRGRR